MKVPSSELIDLAWAQLWQVTVLIVVVGILVRLACQNRPHLAHVLWVLVLVKCLTPPLWSSPTGVFSWAQLLLSSAGSASRSPASTPPSATLAQRESHEAGISSTAGAPKVQGVLLGDAAMRPHPVAIILASVWLTGVVGLAAVTLLRWIGWHRLLRRTALPTPRAIVSLKAELAGRLRLRRSVRLVISSANAAPCAFGLLRPTVVLPQSGLRAHSREHVEPILAHELMHIRRGDTVLAVLKMAAQVLWWFHPSVWWANRQITRHTERCCDEEVMAGLEYSPSTYARDLLDFLCVQKITTPRIAVPGVCSAETTSTRLEDIMRRTGKLYRRTPRYCWAAMFLTALVVLPGGVQQAAGEILFGPPRLLFENAGSPVVSRDGRELYFASERPGGHGELDVWAATRATTEDEWGEPVNLGQLVNTLGKEAPSDISADGLTLLLQNGSSLGIPPRPGGLGWSDIWMTTRATTADDWGTPVNLGTPINSSEYEAHANMSPNGLALYFGRAVGVGPTRTKMNLWMVSRETIEDDWGTPLRLGPPVNSDSADKPGNISTDSLTFVISSGREGGLGDEDLWVTTRATIIDDWGTPVNLGPIVNTESVEFTPWVSEDFPAVGSTLYYMSGDWNSGLQGFDIYAAEVLAPIPEPSTMTLLLGGSLCLLVHVSTLWRKRG